MNYLVEKVSEYMQQNHMVEEGQKIVVGVSGGADSMGLLFCPFGAGRIFSFIPGGGSCQSRPAGQKPQTGISPMWNRYAGNRKSRVTAFMWI